MIFEKFKYLCLLLISLVFFEKNSLGESCEDTKFLLGFGRQMIESPVLPIGMMGYADLAQKISGIHMPLWARSMVVQDTCAGSTAKPIGIVVLEVGMIFNEIRQEVLMHLAKKLPGIFSDVNLLISATHTHSGMGGYAPSVMYNLTVGGYYRSVKEAIVSAAVEALVEAYTRKVPGKLKLGVGQNIEPMQFNRSQVAYDNNPEWERRMYADSVDREMVLIEARDLKGQILGSFNWFGIHPVSLSMQNTLVSGDNKGLAAYLLEKSYEEENKDDSGAHVSRPVAAFVQSKAGDVSPYPVDWGPLPADKGWSRNLEAGDLQFQLARQTSGQLNQFIAGRVAASGADFDLSQKTFISTVQDRAEKITLCSGGLGVAFAAGTENGKPVPIFKEGTIYGVNWPQITLIRREQECQGAKVMLLPTGMGPKPWTANKAPFQLLRIGQLLVVGTPFEITTMAGRRLERMLLSDLYSTGIRKVVLTSLANEYLHYVTTKEEYAVQQYEGGSNLFGPRSLEVYEEIYHQLAKNLAQSGIAEKTYGDAKVGSMPRSKMSWIRNFSVRSSLLGVDQDADEPHENSEFGAIIKGPKLQVTVGEWQKVVWVGARLAAQDAKEVYRSLRVEEQVGDQWLSYLGLESPDTTIQAFSYKSKKSRVKTFVHGMWLPRRGGTFRMCYYGRALLEGTQFKTFYSCSEPFTVDAALSMTN